MIKAKDAVVWINRDTHEVMVRPHGWGKPEGHWGVSGLDWVDPIGALYEEWGKATDAQRVHLMLETVIDLAIDGFAMDRVLTAFVVVEEFRALGSASYPMCRALTRALIGKRLEPNTMTFEELLKKYDDRIHLAKSD